VYHYVWTLRYYEYHLNCHHHFWKWYFHFRHHHLSLKLGILIPPNTFGYGLHIYHPGGIVISPLAHIGNYCSLLHGVTIGQNRDQFAPQIGDRVFLGCGCAVIGKITVCSDVTIGTNAVVFFTIVDPHSSWLENPAKRVK